MIDFIEGTIKFLVSSIIMISFLIVLILSFVFPTQSEIDINNFLIKNWNSKAITNIELSDSTKCSDFEEYTPIVLGYTPGIRKGLSCTIHNINTSLPIQHNITVFNSNEKINTNCKILEAIESQPILKWRNKTICVKYTEKSLLHMKTCKGDYVECGNYNILKNLKFCVHFSEPCPITNITIIDESMKNISPYNTDNFKLIDFKDGSNKYLAISNSIDYEIISSLFIKPGKNCLNPSEYDLNKSVSYPLYEDYELYNECKSLQNGTNYNLNFKSIDVVSGDNLFDSDLYNKFNNLPDFPMKNISQTSLFLYFSNYFSYSCISTSELHYKEYNVEVLGNIRTAIFFFAAVVLIMGVIFFIALFCCNLYSNEIVFNKSIRIGIILFQVVALGLFISVWILYFDTLDAMSSFTLKHKYEGTNCFDFYSTRLLLFSEKQIDYFNFFYVVIGFFGTLLFMYPLMAAIAMSIYGCQFEEQED